MKTVLKRQNLVLLSQQSSLGFQVIYITWTALRIAWLGCRLKDGPAQSRDNTQCSNSYSTWNRKETAFPGVIFFPRNRSIWNARTFGYIDVTPCTVHSVWFKSLPEHQLPWLEFSC